MTEVDAALVRRKLARITRNLDDLRPIEALSLDEYQQERFRRKGVERLLQETIEAAVDANLHLLRALDEPAPGDYFGSFLAAGRAGLLPRALAERLAPTAGLRNRLVHEYDEIDDAIVLDAVAGARRSFTEYVVEVEARLRERGF